MDRETLKVRLLIYMYGGHILEALFLDHLLEKMNADGMTGFSFERIPSDGEKNMQRDLDFLVGEGMLQAYSDNHYDITKPGKLKLAGGGYVGDMKKHKNALFAFRISLVAIGLAVVSFLVSLFR